MSTPPVGADESLIRGRVRGAGNEFILACDVCFAPTSVPMFVAQRPVLGIEVGDENHAS